MKKEDTKKTITLIEDGTLAQIMAMDINNLKQKQYLAFKEHVLKILEMFHDVIKEEQDLDILSPLVNYSPAGDGMGCDNYYIDFGYKDENGDRIKLDINDVIHTLENLKKGLGDKKA